MLLIFIILELLGTFYETDKYYSIVILEAVDSDRDNIEILVLLHSRELITFLNSADFFSSSRSF